MCDYKSDRFTYIIVEVLRVSLNKAQKQPSRGVSRQRYSENMQQIYRITLIPTSDFNKAALQLLLKSHFSISVLL